MSRPRLRVVQCDAVRLLQDMAGETVDLIVTDPAYESLEKHRSKGTTTRLAQSEASSNEWFSIFPNHRFVGLLEQAYRVLRKERHMYVLCDEETASIVVSIAESVGFYFWKTVIWAKTKKGSEPDPEAEDLDDHLSIGMGYHYRNTTERIVFLEKRSTDYRPPLRGTGLFVVEHAFPSKGDPPGKGRQLRDRGMPDLIPAPRVRNGYPTEKPVGLLRKLVEQSSEPGELVVDPFGGSGSTAEAALSCGRDVVTGDLSPKSIEAMTARLAPWLGGT